MNDTYLLFGMIDSRLWIGLGLGLGPGLGMRNAECKMQSMEEARLTVTANGGLQ